MFELDEAARRIGHDAASWLASQLTIDGTTVEAIEITREGWWLVMHIGIGEVWRAPAVRQMLGDGDFVTVRHDTRGAPAMAGASRASRA